MTPMSKRDLDQLRLSLLRARPEEEDDAPPPEVVARAERLGEPLVQKILAQRQAEQRAQHRWRPGRGGIFAGLGAALAAAAALVLVLQGPALPPYQLEVTPMIVGMLGPGEGANAALIHLQPGAALQFTVRPDRRVVGTVKLQCYLRHDGGPLEPWDLAPQESSATGTYHFNAQPPKEGFAGLLDLVVVIAREGAVPTPAAVEAALRGERSSAPGWQLVRQRFEVEAKAGAGSH